MDISHECRWLADRIDGYLDDALSDEATKRFVRHVDACRTCRTEFDRARAILDDLRRLPALECPETIVERVREKTAADPDKTPWWRNGLRSLRPALAAIGVALLVLSAMWFGGVNRTTIGADEVAEARDALRWTLASVGEVNERTGRAVRDEAIRDGLVVPVQRALQTINHGSDTGNHTNGG